jgi:hypothetical protein
MFDLSIVQAALTSAAPSLEQVVLPDGDGTQGVDTAALLVSELGSLVSDRLYPLRLPDDPAHPSAVYRLMGSQAVNIGGYPILQEDSYLLAVAADQYGTVKTTTDSIKTALQSYTQSGGAGTAIVTDAADDYRRDVGLFETGMALTFTHLAQTTQTVPAAFVYLLNHDARPDNKYRIVSVEEESRFAVLLVDRIPTGGVTELSSKAAEIRTAVMAINESGWRRPLWYGGDVLAVHNTLVLWQETFGIPRHSEYTTV